MKKIKYLLMTVIMQSAVILINSCAVNPVTGRNQLMLVSENQELEMGRQYDPQVISTFGEYQNTALQTFIMEKGAEMGKISHRPKLEYHLRILDSPVINAFAVPGGYIYLTRGILAQLNNEAELAGIIGHEMGHITARHTASQQSKQQMGQLLLIGGIIASKEFQEYAEYAMQGMQLLFLQFSRDNEREADRLGVEYSSKIGYDAHKMADFFQVLNKMNMASEHAGIPTFMSTHPDPGDRYNSVNQSAADWQAKLKMAEYKVNGGSYLQMINGLIYGDDPRQGYTEGNTFYHPDMKFRFSIPAGWVLQNSPLQVSMAPEDGKALILFSMSQQKTLEEASKKTLEELGLTATETRNTAINGLSAIRTLSKQVSQDKSTGQQSSIMVLSFFIDYGSAIYMFHGLSAEPDFPIYSKTMESAIVSFSKLTDATKINVKPKKIIIKTTQKPGTLAEVLKTFGVTQKQMAETALLNNLELTDKIQSGRMIKIVGE